jgi:hypothetical protein
VIWKCLIALEKSIHSNSPVKISQFFSRISVFWAAIVALFMTSIALRMTGPTIHPDEFGFLINGQVLLGRVEAPIPTGSFYPAGYGLVTGLGHLMTGSMSGAYSFSLLVNVFLACLTAWCAMRLAVNGFGVSRGMGLMAGALVLVFPGTIVSAMFSWAETAARLSFLILVAIVLRVAHTMSARDIIGLGIFVGALPTLHGRFLLLISVVGALIGYWVVRKRITFSLGMGSLVVMFVAYAGSFVLNTFLKTSVYTTAYDQETRLLRRVVDPSLWPALLKIMMGQTWYLVATSFGLFAVGLVYMLVSIVARVVKNRSVNEAESAVFFVVVFGTLAVIFTGGLQVLNGDRGDHLFYGRYVEMVVPVFLVVACVAFERSFLLVQRVLLCSVVFIPVVALSYVVTSRGDDFRNGFYKNPFVFPNIVGTEFARHIVRPGLLTFAVFFMVATFLLWLLVRWRGSLALLTCVIAVGAASMYSGDRSIIVRTKVLDASGETVAYASANGATHVGFDAGISNDRAYYTMRYLLHPVSLTMLDISSPRSKIPAGLSCAYGWADRPPNEPGWQIVAQEQVLRRVLWQRVNVDSC